MIGGICLFALNSCKVYYTTAEKTVDTVIEYREGKSIYVHEKESAHPNVDLSERVKSNEAFPPLTTLDLKNRGESMREDKLYGIMDGIVY
jgi:hypothetical protein